MVNLEISKEVTNSQDSNILSIFSTFFVSKDAKFNSGNFKHPENILFISVTFEVSKDENSTYSKLMQSLNINDISSTFEVTKFFKFKEVILGNPANIPIISVTLFVLNPETSNEVR